MKSRLMPILLAVSLLLSLGGAPLEASHRHWSKKKKAVVVAGSAAGGALVGGLAGGKRGAAAGAVGAGAAAGLYTATRHGGHRVYRSGKARAALIGGSAAAGALTGGIAAGGKGAAIGAGVGAAGGYLLDRKTRIRRHRKR
jgi:hypothetical protein